MNTVDLMKSLVPPDQPFQLADMLRWLYEVRKGKRFREASVRTYLSRLAARGVIRKLHKTGTNGSLWVSSAATATTGGIETLMPYGEWASQHIVQVGRWNQLAGQWHELYKLQPDLDAKQLREQIAQLNKAKSEIENSEPLDRFDESVMAAAEQAEKKFQSIDESDDGEPGKQAAVQLNHTIQR